MISLRILVACVGRGREGDVDVMCGRRCSRGMVVEEFDGGSGEGGLV